MSSALVFSRETIRPFVVEQGRVSRLDLFVRGVKCGHCVNKISKELDRHFEIVDYEFASGGQRLTLWSDSQSPFSESIQSIQSLGFEVIPIESQGAEAVERAEYKRDLKKLAVAAVCAGNIMLFSTAVYLGADPEFTHFFHKLSLFLVLPVFFYSATSIWYGFWQTLRHQKFNLDFPIGTALALGGFLSLYSFFTGGSAIYFDSITVVVFLILTSRFVLKRYVESIYQKNVVHFIPGVYQARLVSQGKETMIPLNQVDRGQTLKVMRGEVFPADGELLSEQAIVDSSVLTGESSPQLLKKFDKIYAGTRLAADQCLIQVKGQGQDTRVGAYVAQALKNQKRQSEESFRLVGYFTLTVVSISALTFLFFMSTQGLTTAFERAFAIILVACPCAVSFGIPLIRSFSGQLAIKNGLILKNPHILEKLHSIKNIFLDKTGTLTESEVNVSHEDFLKFEKSEQEKILSLELAMDHPISNGFRSLITNHHLSSVKEFSYVPGWGIKGFIGDDLYEAYSADSVAKAIEYRKNGHVLGQIRLEAGTKKDLAQFFSNLSELGYQISVLSGDKPSQVSQIEDLVPEAARGVFIPEATPERKHKELSLAVGDSLMVGDGINDLSAMSAATVSVCMPGALENNMDVADVTLTQGRLSSITQLFALAKKVRWTEILLLAFTASYNLICIVLAILGFITPVAAAILMPISSLTVLSLVTLRLRKL